MINDVNLKKHINAEFAHHISFCLLIFELQNYQYLYFSTDG